MFRRSLLRQGLAARHVAFPCQPAPSPLGQSTFSSDRALSTLTLPDLPYDYAELEPAISGEIMKLHHAKHHATYVANFNAALEKYSLAGEREDIASQIALQSALKFNGGGHVNHSIFWQNLAPPKSGGGEPPEGALSAAIDSTFGSMDSFKARFGTAGAAVQGSGWVWLGYNKEYKSISIATTANQDPLSTVGLVPLLGVDVWEHAYYLQYKNVRPDYLKNIWSVVNWKDVAQRYAAVANDA